MIRQPRSHLKHDRMVKIISKCNKEKETIFWADLGGPKTIRRLEKFLRILIQFLRILGLLFLTKKYKNLFINRKSENKSGKKKKLVERLKKIKKNR